MAEKLFEETSVISNGQNGGFNLKKFRPEEIVVTGGQSWKCPVYVRRLPPCRNECPSSEDIRGYLTYIAQAKLYKRPLDISIDDAWYTLTDKNPMPSTHGRICPHPCEDGCNRKNKDEAVAINNMERFIGDHGLKRGLKLKRLSEEKKSKKVAVIGSGPSGLSCAYQLARRGYPVTIFEAFEKPGGMLRYGIPTYRLPDDILDKEIQNILNLGIELKCNVRIGKDITFEDIQKDYDSVYIAVGAHKGTNLGVEGEESANVFTGAGFLNRVKSGASVEVGRNVVVIGGGDSAVDAARVSLRMGDIGPSTETKAALDAARVTKRISKKANVTLLYRRTKHEMPAIAQDVTEAEHEGIHFEFLAAPVGFVTAGGRATAIKCIRMELGEPDSSGRRRPVPIEGSDFTVSADTVIVGIGQKPELTGGLSELSNKWGFVDAKPGQPTKIPGVFAGGDALELGISTTSVGHGRMAAEAIVNYLEGTEPGRATKIRPIKHEKMRLDYYPETKRNEEQNLPAETRTTGFEEIYTTISEEQAISEANRCMSCGLCFVCDQCRNYCPRDAISKSMKRSLGKAMFTDYTRCNGCHICQQSCPSGYIEMGMGL